MRVPEIFEISDLRSLPIANTSGGTKASAPRI
jgi:hypothetical protein